MCMHVYIFRGVGSVVLCHCFLSFSWIKSVNHTYRYMYADKVVPAGMRKCLHNHHINPIKIYNPALCWPLYSVPITWRVECIFVSSVQSAVLGNQGRLACKQPPTTNIRQIINYQWSLGKGWCCKNDVFPLTPHQLKRNTTFVWEIFLV